MRKFCVFIAAISDLVCVCLCLGQVGQFSKCTRLFLFKLGWCNKSWKDSIFLLRLLLAYVCVRCNSTGVMWKFCIFVVAISSLCVCVCVCMCVCMYVMRCTTRQSCENSMLSLRLFLAYMCVCLLCFVFGPGWAGFEVLVNCGYFRIWNWMCSLPVATFCNFNFWILLRNKWILNWIK